MSLLKDIIFRLTSKNNQSKYQFKSDSEKESSAFNETEINNIQPQNDKRADNKFVIRRPVFVRGIIDAVAEYYGFNSAKLRQKGRKQEIALVRQIAMYLLREYTGKSYPAIGQYFGSRDHTTVMYAHKKIGDLLNESDDLRNQINEILEITSERSGVTLGIAKRMPKVISRSVREFIQPQKPILPQKKQYRFLKPLAPEVLAREKAILSEYRSGKTLEQIGKAYNLTRERIRQIVLRAIFREIESKKNEGFEIDYDEYMRQEKLKRDYLKESKTERIENKKPQRWSRFYAKCRGCGTITIPHLKRGYCEKCLGVVGDKKREEIIASTGGKCERCGIDRIEARLQYGRDFYIRKTKNENIFIVLCRRCFLEETGRKLYESRLARINGGRVSTP